MSLMKFPNIVAFFHLPNAAIHQVSYGILIGFMLSVSATSIVQYISERRRQGKLGNQTSLRPIELRSDEIVRGVTGLIGTVLPFRDGLSLLSAERLLARGMLNGTGNTPLVRINSLSDALGVEILGKAEVGGVPATRE